MIRICWLGQGGFIIENRNCRIVIDPYISDCVFKAEHFARLHPFPIEITELQPDHLLITHDHLDHLDPDGIPLIARQYPECRYAATRRACSHLAELGIDESQITGVEIGQKYTIGPFTVTPTPAFHSDPYSCGFLVESDGQSIVVTGDTRYDEKLFVPEINEPDLMLICINGKLNNMNTDEALSCVKRLKPAAALPMHIGLFAENTADPQPFVEGCRKLGISSFAMTPGEWFTL